MQLDSAAFVVDPELAQALRERSSPIPCDTDRLLFRQDDPAVGVYLLEQGAVTLTMHSLDGRTIFSLRCCPGLCSACRPSSAIILTLFRRSHAPARRLASSPVPISSRSCRRSRHSVLKCSRCLPLKFAPPVRRFPEIGPQTLRVRSGRRPVHYGNAGFTPAASAFPSLRACPSPATLSRCAPCQFRHRGRRVLARIHPYGISARPHLPPPGHPVRGQR